MTPLEEAIALWREILGHGLAAGIDTLDDDEIIAFRLILTAAEEAEGLRAALQEIVDGDGPHGTFSGSQCVEIAARALTAPQEGK